MGIARLVRFAFDRAPDRGRDCTLDAKRLTPEEKAAREKEKADKKAATAAKKSAAKAEKEFQEKLKAQEARLKAIAAAAKKAASRKSEIDKLVKSQKTGGIKAAAVPKGTGPSPAAKKSAKATTEAAKARKAKREMGAGGTYTHVPETPARLPERKEGYPAGNKQSPAQRRKQAMKPAVAIQESQEATALRLKKAGKLKTPTKEQAERMLDRAWEELDNARKVFRTDTRTKPALLAAKAKVRKYQELTDAPKPWIVVDRKPKKRAKDKALDAALGLTIRQQLAIEVARIRAADAAAARKPALAMDDSLRSIDDDGHMVVAESRISKANVCPYFGREIPEYETLGLEPEKTYQLWRHPEELAKGAETFTGKPLIKSHKAISDETPHQSLWVGTVGACAFEAPYLVARPLTIITAEGKALVEQDKQRQLSSGYRYDADMTAGVTPEGVPYDGIMRNIRGNHVALVEEGRAGPDVHVADSLPVDLSAHKQEPIVVKNLKTIALLQARGLVAEDVDLLALDAALGEVPAKSVVKLTADEMKEAEDEALSEKRESEGEDAALDEEEREAAWEKARDKKARDEDPEAEDEEKHEAEDESEEDAEDEEPEEAQDEEEEKPAFLKGKDRARDAAPDESDHRNDFRSGDSKRGHDRAHPSQRKAKSVITADEVNLMLKAERKRVAKEMRDSIVKEQRALAMACDEVQPLVGRLQMHAFDSALEVYQFAAEKTGTDIKGLSLAAARKVIQTELKYAKRKTPTVTDHAMDAGVSDDYIDVHDVLGISRS